jgi:FAD/FMN-containing dehydrogenase
MGSMAISSIVFACVFGGAILGMLLRGALPQDHLGAESKEAVKVGMGLVATMAALVLGLLVASAKSSYDAQSTALTEMSAQIVVLDRVLAHYGPEAEDARYLLRSSAARVLESLQSKQRVKSSQLVVPSSSAEPLVDKIQALSPKNDAQRSLQAQAFSIAMSLGQTRWLMYAQAAATPMSMTLLIVLVFWVTSLFISFGLYAPRNATVIATLFISALSVSGAILVILEMYAPYTGLIRISSAPLRAAIGHLGQ